MSAFRGTIATAVLIAALSPLLLGATNTTDDTACFLAHINAARQTAGLSPVTLDASLSAYALTHTQTMVTKGSLSHSTYPTLPAGWQSWGEDVGMGVSCDVLSDAFLVSPGHRAVILNGRYSSVGIGVAYGDSHWVWVTELFVEPQPPQVEATPPTTQPQPTRAKRPPAPPRHRHHHSRWLSIQ